MRQSFRVLLVEDDDSLRCCLSEFLASHGWEVGAAGSAAEAMSMVWRQRFDFSILDFHLPGMTGLDLFQQLASVRPLPSILMSGLASAEEAAAERQAGFFTFLRKPLELERLRQSVQLLIQTHFGGPMIHSWASDWRQHKPPQTGRHPPPPPAPPTSPQSRR